MIIEKDASFGFSSKVSTPEEIQQELNDIKAILLAVSLKLDEGARQQLVKELLTIPSESIKQWARNLNSIGNV